MKENNNNVPEISLNADQGTKNSKNELTDYITEAFISVSGGAV